MASVKDKEEREMREKMLTWRLNNMLLKNQWVDDEIKEEIKIKNL